MWFLVDKDAGLLEIYDFNGNCIRRFRVSQWNQYKTVHISLFSSGFIFVGCGGVMGSGVVRW
ncbi:MAG: hypothetical protein IPP29_05830 [Bacteroidetes bacterium]|nr:hypothetical protein [Bacteroidota bacterium]